MKEFENRILILLEMEYNVDNIEKELDVDEENLADIVINLEDKGLITLKDRNWTLTEKGKKLLEERREKLKKLKIEYLHGEFDRNEFDRRREELEYIPHPDTSKDGTSVVDIPVQEEIITKDKTPVQEEIITKDKMPVQEEIITKDKMPVQEEIIIKDKMPVQEDTNINCPKCGKENKIGNNFCRRCGTPLNS